MERDTASGNWTVNEDFELDPAVGLCAGAKRGCWRQSPLAYDDIKALQLGEGGRSLVALLPDGIVDEWDLERGAVLRRLRLDEEYTSMCRSGPTLFLSRHDRRGPSLVSMELPAPVGPLALDPAGLGTTRSSQSREATPADNAIPRERSTSGRLRRRAREPVGLLRGPTGAARVRLRPGD